jgi:hypothetical protein
MDFKITSTKARRRRASGMMLVEALMSIGLTGLIMIVLVSISVFSGRSFVAMANYVELDDNNRIAIDTMTRDLRECNKVISSDAYSLLLEDSDGFTITYTYSPSLKTLTRVKAGNSSTLLTGCQTLNFSLGQRNTVAGTFDQFPAASVAEAKVVDVSWRCVRTILGVTANTEAVQTAKIVIRKQGT